MNNKKQNIIIAVICVVLVGFDIFALSLKPSQNVDDDTSTKLAEIVHEPLVPESEQINPVTDKFYINGYMSINDNTTYMTENNAKKELNIVMLHVTQSSIDMAYFMEAAKQSEILEVLQFWGDKIESLGLDIDYLEKQCSVF